MKISLFIFSLFIMVGIIKAEENKKINLNEFIGRYSFVGENSSVDIVIVELQSDSTLKAVASMGSVTLIHVKDDEFKVSEYSGRILFTRDNTKQNIIGVKVNLPSANIETEGKKEQLIKVE